MGTGRYEEEKTTNRILIAGSFKSKMLCIYFLNRPRRRIVNMLIFPVAHECMLLHCKSCTW